MQGNCRASPLDTCYISVALLHAGAARALCGLGASFQQASPAWPQLSTLALPASRMCQEGGDQCSGLCLCYHHLHYLVQCWASTEELEIAFHNLAFTCCVPRVVRRTGLAPGRGQGHQVQCCLDIATLEEQADHCGLVAVCGHVPCEPGASARTPPGMQVSTMSVHFKVLTKP